MIKIQLISFVTIMLITNRKKLQLLIWTIVLSLGFYGIKGGVFSILTGAAHRVYGPEGSFIYDNNALGLALIMIMPLMWYLYTITVNKYIRWGILFAIILTILAVFTTHSRGALLAMSAMTIFLWYKSSAKLWLGIILVISLPVILMNMPDHWYERMGTLKTYEEDKSAMGRITAWEFSYDMARQRIVGGGYDSFTEENYWRFSPEVASEVEQRDGRYQGAHSIYFEVLGEHGFIGLLLFLLLCYQGYKYSSYIIHNTKNRQDMKWAKDFAAMLQVSLVGYAVAGTFLELASFDLLYHVLAMILVTKIIIDRELQASSFEIKHSNS
jgi:probable O-glycosylation ligase (exosortase A-associated)